MAFSPLPPAALEPATLSSAIIHPFPLRTNGFEPPASNRWAQGGRRRRRRSVLRIAVGVGGGGDEIPSTVAAVLSDQQGQVAAAVTWEIVVGATAGVMPFVVAGIEFSKRIVAQRRCEVCGGSGLVLMDNQEYCRCPGCGGFLPWQSWKRFFTG